MTRTLVLLVLVSACTSFDPLERGVCGNGVVEPGEDCDSHDARCVACAVVCSAASDCPDATYACGVDGLCHAPSGVLAPATAPSLFLADSVRITDVDRDGIGDVVGVSKTSITVRHGDAQASLTSADSVVTPAQTGPAAFDDLDGDGSTDVSLVTTDGIVAYESPYGVPSPATSFLPLELAGQPIPIRALFSLNGVALGAVVEDTASGVLFLEVIEFDAAGTSAQVAPLCGLPAADFTPDDLDAYQASRPTDSTVDVVVSFLTKGASGRHLCATAIHLDAPAANGSRAAHLFDITPAISPAPMRKPVWADLDFDGDRCPSLVDSDGGGPLLEAWDGSTAAGHCTIAAARTPLPVAPDAPDTAQAIGHIPFDPGFPGVGGDVLVMTNGLYVYSLDSQLRPALYQAFRSERKLAHVASGDLDGNDTIDAVLTAENDTGIDIVYREGGQLIAGYVVMRVDTAGIVTSSTIGDFDGNGAADIAYTEQLLDHQALSVAYLDPGHTFTTAQQGTFHSIRSVISVATPDSADPYSVIDDLLVLEDLPGASSSTIALTLLHGNPQRVMLSYFEPRQSTDPLRDDILRQVVAGNFASSTGSTSHPDLVAFLPTANAIGTPSITAYRLDGTDAGLDPGDPLNFGNGGRITGIDDCPANAPTAAGAPCIRNAQLAAWTTGAAHDVVVGIDRQATPHGFVIDPWALAAGGTAAATVADVLTAAVPAGAVVRGTHAADLDGDGAAELVVAFGPIDSAPASGPGLVEACTMTPAGVPVACTDLLATVQAVAPAVTACVDAAPGRVAARDPDAATRAALLVLCHAPTGDSILARVDVVAGAYRAAVVAGALGPLRSIDIGDVTGDGVADVVAVRGDAGSRALLVFRQCDARDLACQATGVAP